MWNDFRDNSCNLVSWARQAHFRLTISKEIPGLLYIKGRKHRKSTVAWVYPFQIPIPLEQQNFEGIASCAHYHIYRRRIYMGEVFRSWSKQSSKFQLMYREALCNICLQTRNFLIAQSTVWRGHIAFLESFKRVRTANMFSMCLPFPAVSLSRSAETSRRRKLLSK